ncbi:MAG: alpha/beta fold hydrolase [Nonomuraea sp.]|nr:alpha/beta fold hydrolase [Nonomuraea sp.]
MSIYHEVRGNGPVLLISQSGEGDAGRTKDLVDHLVGDFTVVTYDRRGLSRSVAGGGVSMREHAEDVHELLAGLTDEPAIMLGCSMGASIGLHLAVAHPGQVGLLIAHEPVSPRLLPAEDRVRHERELAHLQQVYREEGLGSAVKLIAEVLGIDPSNPDAEPDLTPHPMNEQRVRNFGYFIEHDFTAVIEDTLDVEALRGTGTRIVPAAGRTTPRDVFDYRCAVALADLVGEEVVTFPGGHNGSTSHPRGYAALLLELGLGRR